MGVVIWIIGIVIWGSIWGVATNAVIRNKGYDENWFWWGFFFGFIALLVALSKPQINTYEYSGGESQISKLANEKRNEEMLRSNGWKCSKCGRVNPSYTGTCGCGTSKMQSEALLRKREEEKRKILESQSETDNVKKIKEYKELLDSGIITQEEFDKKKAELLKL